MNLHFGRGTDTPDARMEAELSSWLRAFEPAATPIALRVRVSADLRTEAQRPRRPLPWVLPALSSMASLAAVVSGAAMASDAAATGLATVLAAGEATAVATASAPRHARINWLQPLDRLGCAV